MERISENDVREAIVSSFDQDELMRLLRFVFDIRLDHIVNVNGPFGVVVAEVVDYFSRRDTLRDLIAVVARERPLRGDVQALYRRYAATGVDDRLRQAVDEAVAQANRNSDRDQPSVEVQQQGHSVATVPPGEAGLERTLNNNLGFFDAALFGGNVDLMKRRVCRVELNDSPTLAHSTMSTGFLVGPQAVLTGYNVLESIIAGTADPAKVTFRFDYAGEADGMVVRLHNPADRAAWLLSYAPYSAGEANGTPENPPPTANELDYALVRLDTPVGDQDNRGWVTLPDSLLEATNLPFLAILHHPRREPLRLTLDSRPNSELKFGGLRLHYAVNTSEGSGGAPVFDKEWRLIALHHYSDPARTPRYKQGVPSWLIRAHIARTPLALSALGGAIDSGRRLGAAVAAANAISSEYGAGKDIDADEAAVITEVAAAPVMDPRITLIPDDWIRKMIKKPMGTAFDKLEKGISGDRVERAKAVDEFRADICDLLRHVKKLNGGELPDDLNQLWVDNGCG